MRIGELSKRSGVPVPTIKYYLREKLLPAGVLTSPNQAHYGEEHLRRLRLVRALVEVGELPIAAVSNILHAIDTPGETLHNKLGQVQEAITKPPATELDPEAVRLTREFMARHGKGDDCPDDRDVEEHAVPRLLAAVLSTARSLGHDRFHEQLEAYVEGLRIIAEADLKYLLERASSVDDAVEGMVVGTILGDAALVAVRRLAHALASERLVGGRE